VVAAKTASFDFRYMLVSFLVKNAIKNYELIVNGIGLMLHS
jgi:hypothetical protein